MFTLLCGALLVSSCNEQARGFALPEGEVLEGKVIYMKFSCNECHSISDIEWKGGSDSLNIPLGGEVTNKKTYGGLVTSVINPSHEIAQQYKQEGSTEEGLSKMENYNEVMTIQELIDLVAFLQSEYKIKAPPENYYYPYPR
ncbi:hypothetical protein [Ekhidna sp.]